MVVDIGVDRLLYGTNSAAATVITEIFAMAWAYPTPTRKRSTAATRSARSVSWATGSSAWGRRLRSLQRKGTCRSGPAVPDGPNRNLTAAKPPSQKPAPEPSGYPPEP